VLVQILFCVAAKSCSKDEYSMSTGSIYLLFVHFVPQ
jgi:hypothetical protein